MFDLIIGKTKRMPGGGGGPVLVSAVIHVGVLGSIVILPLLYVTNALPEVPAMMAFVASAPEPSPPPPPPPPKARAETATVKPTPSSSPDAAPIEIPSRIEPEIAATTGDEEGFIGVEGGLPGGVLEGIVGGLPDAPPPPPPPAPPATRVPVRVGGQIQPPALLTKVDPIYPDLALKAHTEGTVILEAIVNENGEVRSVRVLRSIPLLDKAAIAAVQQWRYSPVILNGTPVPFLLTVVLTFSIPESRTAPRY